MKVAFWSPVPGQAGVTASAIGVAVTMAAKGERSCVLVDCHYDNHRLSDYLWRYECKELGQYERALGMDALFRYGNAQSVTREQLRAAAISFMQEKLLLITGTRKNNAQLFYGQLQENLASILKAAKELQGYVFFDVESGNRMESLSLLEQMDQIIICMPQNPMVIQEYFRKYSFPLSKIYFLLGNYRKESGFNKRNLQKQFRNFHSYNIGTISYCSTYGDALCRGEGLRYLMRNTNTSQLWKKQSLLMEELEQVQKQLVSRLEGKEKHIETTEKRNPFIR